MRLSVLFLFSLLVLVGCSPAAAQTEDAPRPAPVILTDEQDEYPLGLYLELLEDPSGELTIQDVTSPEFDPQFVPSRQDVVNFGYSESAHWVRLQLRSESSLNERWLLDAGFANIHFIDLYTLLPNGEGFTEKHSGILRSPETRDIRHPRIIFSLPIPAQGQQIIYLRVESGSSPTFPITLWAPDAFFSEAQWELVVFGLYFGILIGLLFYNLFVLFSLREISYLYLVIVLGSMIVFDAAYSGYLEVYVVPTLYYLRPYYVTLSFALVFVSMILFADSFLELKEQNSKVHWASIVVLGGWAVLALLVPFVSYFSIATLMVPWAIPSLLIVLVAGIASLLSGYRPARFFMLAWAGLVITFSLVLLVRVGIVPSTVITENAYRLGWVWMAVCWSIALADRINMLKAETDSVNRDLRDSEHRLSQTLEGLPIGVVVYGTDQKLRYINQRTVDILENPARGIKPEVSAGRTLAQALAYFSFQVAGSREGYPLESFPAYRALHGEPASVDDIEADLLDKRVPLEIWASPVRNSMGEVESAVVAFQDITKRRRIDTELKEYRENLEQLVKKRTAELTLINERLNFEAAKREKLEELQQERIEWLTSLTEISHDVRGSADLQPAYDALADQILQILKAGIVFIFNWDGHGEQRNALAYVQREEFSVDLDTLAASFRVESPLKKEIEQHRFQHICADQLETLPEPIRDLLPESDPGCLLIAPLIIQESVVGVLGLKLPQHRDEFIQAQEVLVKDVARDLADLAEDAHLLDQARALVASEERNRLARDLHDSVTQVLFSASLVAEVLPRIWRRDPARAMESLKEVRRLTRGALAEMRTMLLELRPTSVLKTSLPELLAQLAEAITSRTELPFQLSIEQISPLPEDVHISFYRVAQEALNNVVKHAQASDVSVSLGATPLAPNADGGLRLEVSLEIEDNGIGFSVADERAEQMGLDIMNERAGAIDADLCVDSQPGNGTRVILTWQGGMESAA
jgi:signal transduction histidine kinase